MTTILDHKVIAIIILIFIFVTVFAVAELLYVKYSGESVAVPNIPRNEQIFGQGPPLTYAVLGDSTGVGQGAEYSNGIAVQTAQFMAARHTVKMTNFAISGATTNDVLENQVKKAAHLKPDIVLVAIGANDVTKLSSLRSVAKDMNAIITQLREAQPDVYILLTGSPHMGSVPRFPWPINFFAKLRTRQINDIFETTANHQNVVLAPIAEKTGDIFAHNPDLFAQDNFHPNAEGYATWVPVLTKELSAALKQTTIHDK